MGSENIENFLYEIFHYQTNVYQSQIETVQLPLKRP